MRSLTCTDRRRRHRQRGGNLLLDVPSLRDGDPRLLAELAPHTDRLRLPPGRTLVRAGETARELIVIVAGEATVLRPGGERTVLHAGNEVGGPEVLRNEHHAATVVAASDIEVVVVNGPAVRWAHQEGVGRSSRWAGRTSPAPVRRSDVTPRARLAS